MIIKKESEDQFQKACVMWFEKQYPQYHYLLHHSPNGGKRNAAEGAKFKAMGTRAGFPDLSLYIAKGGFHALFIELKIKKNKQQPAQINMQKELEAQGYKYVLCNDFDLFIETINNYLKYS